MPVNNISDIRHLMVYYNPVALDYVVWDGTVSGIAGGSGGMTDLQFAAHLPLYQAVQPVSLAVAPVTPVTGVFYQATQPVSMAVGPTTPVTGTFWQATQPVSGTFWQATQPVSGTFWQATQPISATQLPAALAANGGMKVEGVAGGVAQPVSGTFFQTTQPISATQLPAALAANGGMKIEGVASGVAVPVSGTFWQGTQPVSGAFFQATQPVSGTFWQATQPVSGTFWQATQPVSQAVLTKGTQGATGVSTQDLKDAGRNVTNYFTALGIAATTAEVMQSLTGYKAGAAVVATATPAVVTAAKTYRVTSITLSYQSLATAGAALVRLRANLSGAGVVTSPLAMTFTIGSAAAVAGVTTTLDIPFPDGLEFAAGTGIAVGVIGIAAAGTSGTAAGFVSITIYGYEY